MLNFVGHQRQIEYLDKALQKGNFSHCYLFYGPDGVGKFTLAKNLAKFFYCGKKPKSLHAVCGQCRECIAIETNTHPQIAVIDIEHTLVSKKDKRKEIPIEDIRELKRRLALAPEKNKWRIVIINQADKMSAGAANSFLKLLEEPGEQILFILIAPGRDLLFETLVSRCQSLAFHPIPEKEMVKLLESKGIKNQQVLKKIIRYAAGRPGKALGLLETKTSFEKEEKFYQDLALILEKGEPADAFLFSEKASQDEELQNKTTEYTLRFLRAKLLQETNSSQTLEIIRKIKNASRIAAILETTNVNPRLALDLMLIESTCPVPQPAVVTRLGQK